MRQWTGTLDALVYPSWNNPPRLIGDLDTLHGNNSNRIAPPTGFAATTVPMGFVHGSLPVGLQILSRPWSEPTLIKIRYAYEQAMQHPASASVYGLRTSTLRQHKNP